MNKNFKTDNSIYKFNLGLSELADQIDGLRYKMIMEGFNDIRNNSSVADIILGLDALENSVRELRDKIQAKKDTTF